MHIRRVVRTKLTVGWTCLIALCLMVALPARASTLSPETLAAFKHYVTLTEAHITKQVSDPSVFLYLNTLPASERDKAFASLKGGGVYLTAITTRDASGGKISVPSGLVHHWLGAVFIPGASIADVLMLIQDYDHESKVYPEVVRSRLISRDGEHFKVAIRFRERHTITVTLDTEFDITYIQADPEHWHTRSYSTSVRQVKNAGQHGERALPDGQGDGFLWRIDSFWRLVQRDGGVYVEVEAVSLTRDIPTGLGWAIKPFITSVPKESLESTLNSTRSAVLARLKHGK